ncbi:MAG: hypothetical protein AAF467_04225 [Actinomycetota bacterium]
MASPHSPLPEPEPAARRPWWLRLGVGPTVAIAVLASVLLVGISPLRAQSGDEHSHSHTYSHSHGPHGEHTHEHPDDLEPIPLQSEPAPTSTTTTVAAPPTTVPPAAPPTLADPGGGPDGPWAFEETFDGDPASPSQDLLPRTFDYVATHRTHAKEHFTKTFDPYPADHADNCAGPNPEVSPLPQHLVATDNLGNGENPDESFFICKNHMMSSMGEVGPYSISTFWPRQEFDFSDGGTLEWEVNVNLGHENRSWWEVMIAPRDQLKVAAGPVDSAIDETYPNDRIVLDFRRLVRRIKVGTDDLAPNGWLVNERQRSTYDWAYWNALHPEDPAVTDRRVRRTMRVTLDDDQIHWGIETADGTFDTYSVDVPGGLPFDKGLVMFKTHAYTPSKNDNTDTFTFHWDNIRFDGPMLQPYDAYYADDVVYLQRNGDRPIGDSQTVTVDLPEVGSDPVLFGQVHQPLRGQVLLSINGGPDTEVGPYEYDRNDCQSNDWKSFRVELDPAQLRTGANTLTWTVGPRPSCMEGPYVWDGFSIKALQVQMN